jgi:hypothetical protein
MKNDYTARKYTTEQKERIKRDRTIKEMEAQHQDDLDIIAAQNTELLKLNSMLKDYQERYNKECYNVVVNNGYVSQIHELPAYREYLPLQPIEGYDMNKITQFMQTPLYAKIPFVYIDNRQLCIDKTKYKKFIGGLI